MDLSTLVVAAEATLKTWAAKKGLDAAWQSLGKYFEPKRLVSEIEAALRSNVAVITPAPTLYRNRIDERAVKQILLTAITKDSEALGAFLLDQQLVALPSAPEKRPESFATVWLCIADAVIKAACVAVAKDQELSRQLELVAQELGHERHVQLLAEFQSLRRNQIDQGAQLNRIEEHIRSSAVTEPLSRRTESRCMNLLADENESLEQQLRIQLGQTAESLWQGIIDEIQEHNFQRAIALGKDLDAWLESNWSHLSSDVRGRGLLLLAQVAFISKSEEAVENDTFDQPRELLSRATEAFGSEIVPANQLRISVFQAKLLSIDGRDSEALALLGDATDAQTVATRLLIFMDDGDFTSASASIRDLPLDLKWCDHAAYVFASLGDRTRVDGVLAFVRTLENRVVEQRCRIAVARGTVNRIVSAHQGAGGWPPALCDSETSELEFVLQCLAPIEGAAHLNSTVESGLHAEALGIAYNCCRLLGRRDAATRHAELLKLHEPIHLEYANAVVRGDVPPDKKAGQRLRDSRPRSFFALFMAAVADLESGSGKQLVAQLPRLADLAKSDDEKTKLARLAVQMVSSTEDDAELELYRSLLATLVGSQHYLYLICDVHRLLENDQLREAEALLDAIPEKHDPLVAQFRAHALRRSQKYAEAAEVLCDVGLKLSEPELLKDAAALALDATPSRLDIAVTALEKAISIHPSDIKANRMLAHTYIQLRGFARAAECLRVLRQQDPTNVQNAMNLAQCCALSQQAGEAIAIYDELCSSPNAPLKAHLARSLLIASTGNLVQAFASLHELRSANWEDADFVTHYMSRAYAANQDRLAHEAFQQLWLLQARGSAPQGVLQPKTLDDLVQFAKDSDERRRSLLDESLAGRFPWIFVESLLNHVPYWGWCIRTQPLPWIYDDPRNRAAYSIYATNGYGVLFEEGKQGLVRVRCPDRGNEVVADLSALITLHRLGLIDAALEYFGGFRIPSTYPTEAFQHSGQLQPHQLSRKLHLEIIAAAVNERKIAVASTVDGLAVVDEYRGDEEPLGYVICDLLGALERAGYLSSSELKDAARYCKPRDSAADLAELSVRDPIAIDLGTLQTLAGQQLLPRILSAFDRVSILESEHNQALQELRGYSQVAQTLAWHETLWSKLGGDSRVDSKTVLLPPVEYIDSRADDEECEDDHIAALDSVALARQERLPLLADDRVCQNIALRDNGTDDFSAFGTDCLLMGMLNAGILNHEQVANAFLQLLEWRYRFLLVPRPILFTLVKHYPHKDLQKVARYVHDCMRDKGLFGGPEATDPPLPIAFRYFQDWQTEVAKVLVDVWLDQELLLDEKSRITDWALSELLPAVPTSLGPRIGRVANFSALTILHNAMAAMCVTPDYSLANTALRAIARGLCLTDDEFVRIAAEVVNQDV